MQISSHFSFEPIFKTPNDIIRDERKKKVQANRKRGLRFSRATFQNKITLGQLNEYWQNTDTTESEDFYLMKLRSSLAECCHHSLWREHGNGSATFIGAHTCKHKYCHVCNAERSKIVRKQYWNFFQKNPDLIKDYDFMHLTLTVPHSPTGFRGKQFYADELIKEFNWMRKKTQWKSMVYAGEFGVEVTKNENGLHIHIHSMLLVYKGVQNRNKLHRFILQSWSNQTAGSVNRLQWTDSEVNEIKKSNKLLTDLDISRINPTGATIIGLESLYIKSHRKKDGYHWCKRSKFWKKYCKPTDAFESFMGGVMECIKYHFQPLAMKDNGTIDFELMREVLPMIYGKSLYQRFGAFHGATKNAHEDCKMLSNQFKEVVTVNDIQDEVNRLVEDNAEDEVINPETLEPCSDYRYVIMSLRNVYFKPDEELKPIISSRCKKKYLECNNISFALNIMLQLTIAEKISKHKDYYAID